MEETKSKRYRIQISTSVKGIKTYEAVVDMTGFTREEVLTESDNLVKDLDSRYPPHDFLPVEVQ